MTLLQGPLLYSQARPSKPSTTFQNSPSRTSSSTTAATATTTPWGPTQPRVHSPSLRLELKPEAVFSLLSPSQNQRQSQHASGGPVASFAPSSAATCLDRPSASITASAAGLRAVASNGLRGESIPATAGGQHGQCLWRIRAVHERSHGPGRGAVWTDCLQTWPGIRGAERTPLFFFSFFLLTILCLNVSS